MQTVLKVEAGADDSQSVELRDRVGMAVTVLTLQQCRVPCLVAQRSLSTPVKTRVNQQTQIARLISSSMVISDSLPTSRHVRFAFHVQRGSR